MNVSVNLRYVNSSIRVVVCYVSEQLWCDNDDSDDDDDFDDDDDDDDGGGGGEIFLCCHRLFCCIEDEMIKWCILCSHKLKYLFMCMRMSRHDVGESK